jgi:hypothetical protein
MRTTKLALLAISTTLRYAIERFPEAKRKALKRPDLDHGR